ncbi:hypothetical protein MLD38_036058 [Melastoma candidum]|uniref:Uncharacterized protein n=1 Tax=Melastoma candidum TaxID=119954 RepID=A0ACB9LIJ4_9MYRT|nr:hypothetical protein MLD38_036058 [Melastoma candidum]
MLARLQQCNLLVPFRRVPTTLCTYLRFVNRLAGEDVSLLSVRQKFITRNLKEGQTRLAPRNPRLGRKSKLTLFKLGGPTAFHALRMSKIPPLSICNCKCGSLRGSEAASTSRRRTKAWPWS